MTDMTPAERHYEDLERMAQAVRNFSAVVNEFAASVQGQKLLWLSSERYREACRRRARRRLLYLYCGCAVTLLWYWVAMRGGF